MRGDENRSRRSRLCGKALRGRDLGQTLAKRTDDAPAAHVGAKSDGETTDGNDPQLRTRTGRLEAHGDQRQRDDAHRLLCVVCTMGERDEARRHRLAVAESRLDLPLFHLTHHEKDQLHRAEGRKPRDHRAYERGDEHLGEHRGKIHAFNACTHDDGTDQAAKQGMRGARRQADEPGDEVPYDCADQSGKNEGRADGDLLLVDDAARDGLRHLG